MDPVNEVSLLLHKKRGVANTKLLVELVIEKLPEESEVLALANALF